MIENKKAIYGLSQRKREIFDLIYVKIDTSKNVPIITNKKQLEEMYGKLSEIALRCGSLLK